MARALHQQLLCTLGITAAGISVAVIARAVVRRRHRIHFAGRVAIVTAGARGLGLLIAEELGRRGANVAICGRTSDAVDEAAQKLRQKGVKVIARTCDLGDRAQAGAFVDDVALEWGRIDVLVNNAGVIHVEPAQSVALDALEQGMRLNFCSAANTTFAALPFLMEQAGQARIANVTSIGGRIAVPHLLGYSASKFALLGLSEGLVAELDRSGVRVTSIVPWFSLGMLPGLSVDPRRAARRIVGAIQYGDPILHVGVASAVAARLHAVAPWLFAELRHLMNRALPAPHDHPEPARLGREIDTPLQGSVPLYVGDEAARENNEAPPRAQEMPPGVA